MRIHALAISPENSQIMSTGECHRMPPKRGAPGGRPGTPDPMTGGTMPLTDAQCRKATAAEKDYKLGDSGGLYLFVTAKGGKSWRMKYRFAGKEKRLTFGRYPEVTLVEARDRRDAARRLLRDYRDPAIEEHKRKMAAHAAAGATMEKIGRAWHDAQTPRWSPKYATKLLQALERDVFPDLGSLPLADIDGPMVLRALRKIEARGSVDTAKRVREYVSAIFVYGMSEGIVPGNPAATVGKALRPIVVRGKQPALTDLAQLRALMAKIDRSSAGPATKLASRLLALTAVRPGVLCGAAWAEIEGVDWSDPTAPTLDAVWRIPAERMKLELESKGEAAFAHDVPLSVQAVNVLRALRRLTGRIALMFPGQRSTHRAMSTAALETLYKREGYQDRHVPHGWRSAFSTVLNDRPSPPRLETDRHVVDLMLAHKPKGLSGSEFAYNRSQHTARRRELAQQWADMLCEGLVPANDLVDGRDR